LFPEYANPDNNENVTRNNTAYNNGLYLPRRNKVDKYHKRN
jgi:hypothetical protein